MPNIAEELRRAAEILLDSGIVEPRREAVSLLCFALRKDKNFLVAHGEYELSNEEEKRFREFLQRRARREPFQYITGKQEFCGLDFLVAKDVLIPRPETEMIVENAIEILRGKNSAKFCEVGVGSGCISVSILHAIETARATGLDISEKALQIAAQNARRHEVSERLTLKISDVFANLKGEKDEKDEKFDLIVSNPPYISSEEVKRLQPEVRDFEPLNALTDGENGLTIIERIIRDAPNFLKPNCFLLLEIGFSQAEKVRRMFSPQIWRTLEILPDLQNIPRMAKARIKS